MLDLLAELNSTTIVENAKAIIAPVLLLIIGLQAAKFLKTQQTTKFIQYLAIAIAVIIIFYSDAIIRIAQGLGSEALDVEVLGADGGISESVSETFIP